MDITKLLEQFGPVGGLIIVIWWLYVRLDAERGKLLEFMRAVHKEQMERQIQNVRAKVKLAQTLQSLAAVLEKIGASPGKSADVQRDIEEFSERIVLHGEEDPTAAGAKDSAPKGRADGEA